MGTFTVKTRKRDGATAAETSALAYRARWVMNAPSEAIVTLNDVAFAETQQYTALGASTYLGFGQPGAASHIGGLQIEEPTATQVFDGFIVRVVPQPRTGTVELHCRDLLHQYEGPKIVYDTRENLDGAGLRESVCYRMDTAGPSEHGIVLSGGNYRLYDTIASWADNAWTVSQHYLCFSTKMAGSQTFWHGLATESYTNCSALPGTDFSDSWFRDNNIWRWDATNNGDLARVAASVYCYTPYAKLTNIKLDFDWSVDPTTATQFYIQVYNYRNSGTGVAAGWYTIYDQSTFPSSMPTTKTSVTLADIAGQIGCGAVGDLIEPNTFFVYFYLYTQSGGAAQAATFLPYFRVTFTSDECTVDTTAYPIDADGADYVEVSENLITAGIDKHAPYSISRVITAYVKDLVDTYDTRSFIDTTTDLTASTRVLTRHFHYMSVLAILQELAQADGTEFWLDSDKDFHWLDPYTVAGAPALTDSDVLYWTNTEVSVLSDDLANDAVVLGQRSTTEQVTGTDADATSDDNYGTHSVIAQNPNIYTERDADIEAGLLIDRLATPRFIIGYAVNGFSTRVVGAVVNVNSTQLNIPNNTYYVVTEKRYDSTQGVTEFTLTLRSTTGLFAPRKLEDGTRWITGEVTSAQQHVSYDPLHTEVWT